MAETLIKVENLSKKFCLDLKTSLWYGFRDIGREVMGQGDVSRDFLRKGEFWAVRDISFEVRRGECLGLIGRNGAGKSTLLKMLNGLIRPDTGRIELMGRVGALIELGSGFNPILTGRENIYINASVLGLTREEINLKFEEIVAFSEIGEFLDTPVQYYSSGMKVRLGFAVAAHVEPDVLLIDEVLAVGDMGFVLKCFNKMDELMQKTAMIFVSHNMPQVSRICNEVIVLTKGKVYMRSNEVSEGISAYYDLFDLKPVDFIGNNQASLDAIWLTSGKNDSRSDSSFEIRHGDPLEVHLDLNFKTPLHLPSISLMFYDKEQRNFGEVFNFRDAINLEHAEGRFSFVARFREIQMGQGVFSITIGLSDVSGGIRRSVFRRQSAIYFRVKSARHGWAPMQFTPEWQLNP